MATAGDILDQGRRKRFINDFESRYDKSKWYRLKLKNYDDYIMVFGIHFMSGQLITQFRSSEKAGMPFGNITARTGGDVLKIESLELATPEEMKAMYERHPQAKNMGQIINY